MDTALWQHHQGCCTKELQGKEERERPGESSESSKNHVQLKGQLASTPGDTGLGGSAERGWSDEADFLKAVAFACSAASLLPGKWVQLSPWQLDGSPVPPCAHRENWSHSRAHRIGVVPLPLSPEPGACIALPAKIGKPLLQSQDQITKRVSRPRAGEAFPSAFPAAEEPLALGPLPASPGFLLGLCSGQVSWCIL